MKPFIDIVERPHVELGGRWKDDGAPAPCRSVIGKVKPLPPGKEEKRPMPGSQYQWDQRKS